MSFKIRTMQKADALGAAALQKLAFPPPFSEDLHWDPEHLLRHIEIFPDGQFVAEAGGEIVGSCSNTIVSEAAWQAHAGWSATVGGPMLRGFRRDGTTLYGLDIAVHPSFRRQGIGRGFYETRFDLVRRLGLTRYGTACRMPDYLAFSRGIRTPKEYAVAVTSAKAVDRTLTPLLRYGLTFIDVVENYMEDRESGNAAALLEWRP